MKNTDVIKKDKQYLINELTKAGAKVNGSNVRCPFCDDKRPSGSIYRDTKGDAWRYRCHKCGFSGDVFDVIAKVQGQPLADVLREHSSPGPVSKHRPVKTQTKIFPDVEAVERHFSRSGSVTIYSYLTETEQPFQLVVRIDKHDGEKDIKQLMAVDNGFVFGAPAKPRKLYRLQDISTADPVFVVEGEKCVHALNEIDFTATTSPMGAKNARSCDWGPLAGKMVYIWPDNDLDGSRFADDVIDMLAQLDNPPRVMRINPESLQLGPKGDVYDYLQGHAEKIDSDVSKAMVNVMDGAEEIDLKSMSKVDVEGGGETSALELITYKPFPVEVLPESLGRFITEAAEALYCDPAFLALPVLVTMASAIGNSRRIFTKDSWSEPSILWDAVVAGSGTMKSPALEKAIGPVELAQSERYHDYQQEQKDFDAQGENGTKPVYEPIKCSDVTVEALALRLKQAPRGLLVVSDELSGWFRSFGQYKAGKGGDVAHWLTMYNGRNLQMDRKKNDEIIYVTRASVSILGTVQPDTLRRCLIPEYLENGLAARFLLAMPPRRKKRWTEAVIDIQTEDRYSETYSRLLKLEPSMDCQGRPEPRDIQFSPEAKRLWIDFFSAHAEELEEVCELLRTVYAKLEGVAARLAMIIYCAKSVEAGGDATGPVGADSMAAAVRIVEWLKNESRRVYEQLDEKPEDRKRRELIELIRSKGKPVSVRDMQRCFQLFGTAEEWTQALDDLAAADLGCWEYAEPGPQGGHPKKLFRLN